MVTDKKKKDMEVKIRLGKTVLKQVQEFRHLGSTIMKVNKKTQPRKISC